MFVWQDKQSWFAEQEIYNLPQMSHDNVLRFIGRLHLNISRTWRNNNIIIICYSVMSFKCRSIHLYNLVLQVRRSVLESFYYLFKCIYFFPIFYKAYLYLWIMGNIDKKGISGFTSQEYVYIHDTYITKFFCRGWPTWRKFTTRVLVGDQLPRPGLPLRLPQGQHRQSRGGSIILIINRIIYFFLFLKLN